jgi:thioredoxin-like negative regulator of GroEL
VAALALALAPGSATVLVTVARARSGDPTLDASVAQARAEAALRDALRADPGHAEARVLLARLLVGADRFDDAEEVLGGLVAPAAGRPEALAARARTAAARGLPERSEALAAEAAVAGESCDAAQVSRALAEQRQALAHLDDATRVLARCRGGRELLARHLRQRGDPAGAAAALEALLAARPWDVGAVHASAEILVAQGKPRAAAERLAALVALWPRDPRLQTARAEFLELAGDRPGARAARERALLLDGGDLALRRALALEDGKEALDDLAFDPREAIRAYEAAGRRDGTTAVMVLDAAAIDIHPGGVATERTQQVVHVLDQAGVDEHGEVSPPAGAEVLALRTLKPDGRELQPDRTSDDKGAVSLTGLEPGDYVLIDYIRAVRAPFAAQGYAADPFYFQVAGERLFRSTYVVRAPAGAGLTADAHRMPAAEVVRQGRYDLVRAEQRDVPPHVPEPDAPSLGEYLPSLAVGTGASREAFQRNVADRLAGKTLATEEILAFARQIRAEAKDASPMGLARAAYARVAKTILGEGPLLEDASETLSRGRGNRLVVLQAVLEALGLEARIALVRPFSADPSYHRFPTPSIYPVQVLRVRAGGEVTWLDPSTRANPFGALPGWLSGCEALVLPAPGEPPSEDRTPETASNRDRKSVELRVVLAADGGAELAGTDRYEGTLGAVLKGQLEPLDESERRQALEGLLGRAFPGMTVTALSFEGEDDFEAPLVIRWKGRSASLARPVAGGLVLDTGLLPAELGPRYVRLATRTTPLLVQMAERGTSKVEIVAPPKMRVAPASPTRLEGPFGTYERTDRETEGGGLVREERLELARARVPPERYRDFASFAAEVDALQQQPVHVTR